VDLHHDFDASSSSALLLFGRRLATVNLSTTATTCVVDNQS